MLNHLLRILRWAALAVTIVAVVVDPTPLRLVPVLIAISAISLQWVTDRQKTHLREAIVLLGECSGQGVEGFCQMSEFCNREISRAMLLPENAFSHQDVSSHRDPYPVSGNSLRLAEYERYYQVKSQVEMWCEENGYTELFHQEGNWWAFPPHGAMPVPLCEVMNGRA